MYIPIEDNMVKQFEFNCHTIVFESSSNLYLTYSLVNKDDI